jgi:hypothetical protein
MAGMKWDLHSSMQEVDETVYAYIQRFSKKKNFLPGILEGGIITAFVKGLGDNLLVHEITWKDPQTSKELFDIANNFGAGDEAIHRWRLGTKDGAKEKAKGKSAESPRCRDRSETSRSMDGKKHKGSDYVAIVDWVDHPIRANRGSRTDHDNRGDCAQANCPARTGPFIQDLMNQPCHMHGPKSTHLT